jgi:hypothetical protein
MTAHATSIESPSNRSHPPALRILSLGGGRQSSTLLYLALEGDLPRPDAAIFADTKREPYAVQVHLDYLRRLVGDQFPLLTVSAGDIRADALDSGRRFASMPLHVKLPNGEGGQLLRQCTAQYKLRPICAEIRRLLGVAPGKRVPRDVRVEQWIGFSLDEVSRVKPSRYAWIDNAYPLIDRRMRVEDCVRWCVAHRYPVAPKSACLECPYHDDAYWRGLRAGSPEEWADVIAFDAALRTSERRLLRRAYLHRSCLPLANVDLRSPEERGQLSLLAGTDAPDLCGEGCYT